jgi:hypothetical protein
MSMAKTMLEEREHLQGMALGTLLAAALTTSAWAEGTLGRYSLADPADAPTRESLGSCDSNWMKEQVRSSYL